MRRLGLWLMLAAACLAAAGCSFVRLGYDTLPRLLAWELDGYLALDDEQKAIVARHLEEIHRWHRREQLPEYGVFLRRVDDELRNGGVDAGRIAAWRTRVGAAWTPLAERLAPLLVDLAPTLRPAQVERLRQRLEASDRKFRERHLPPEAGAIVEERGDRLVKRAKFFFGEVSFEQGQALRVRAAALPPAEEAWYLERKARNEALVALIDRLRRERMPRERALEIARAQLASMWRSPDPQRRARIEQSLSASDALSAAELGRATSRQRAYLSQLIAGYAQDAEVLAASARPEVVRSAERGALTGAQAAPLGAR